MYLMVSCGEIPKLSCVGIYRTYFALLHPLRHPRVSYAGTEQKLSRISIYHTTKLAKGDF